MSWYEAAFKEVKLDYHLSCDEIEVNGDWSFASGTGWGRPPQRLAATRIELSAKFLEIHRRQPDGSWKFARHMWNSER